MQPWYRGEAGNTSNLFYDCTREVLRSFVLSRGLGAPHSLPTRPFPSMRFPGFFYPASPQIPISRDRRYSPTGQIKPLPHSRVRTVSSTSARLTERGSLGLVPEALFEVSMHYPPSSLFPVSRTVPPAVPDFDFTVVRSCTGRKTAVKTPTVSSTSARLTERGSLGLVPEIHPYQGHNYSKLHYCASPRAPFSPYRGPLGRQSQHQISDRPTHADGCWVLRLGQRSGLIPRPCLKRGYSQATPLRNPFSHRQTIRPS